MNLDFVIIDKHDAGFITKPDRSQLPPGAMKTGSQNIVITDGDRIGIRNGLTLFGATSAAATPVTSSWTHHRRNTTNPEIQLRAYGTVIDYFHPTTAAWEQLKGSFTTGLQFGFSDYDRNADSTAHVRFGNTVEDDMRWNGQFTLLDGALTGGEATITVDSTTGFTTPTGSLIIGTTEVTYTGTTATTFTGCVGTPAAADNAACAQLPVAFPSNPKGNIYVTYQNRLCIANITGANNTVFISAVDDDTDFTASSPRVDGEAAIINVSLGAGTITGLAVKDNQLWIGKKFGWHVLEFRTFDSTNTDFPFLTPVNADATNPFLGPENSKTVFIMADAIMFGAENGGIKTANKFNESAEPFELSDPIRPTVNQAGFDDAAGILFDNKAYIAAKEKAADSANNIVFVYNVSKGAWEAPIKGWNISAWNILGGELYGHSSINPKSFRFNEDITSDEEGGTSFPVKALFRSGDLNFGSRELRKEFDGIYVEGFISENTTITIRIVYEFDGQKGTKTGTFSGTESTFILQDISTAELGLEELALEELAITAGDPDALPKFRVYFTTTMQPFYEMSIEFESDAVEQQWQILAWGFNVRGLGQIDTKLKKQLL